MPPEVGYPCKRCSQPAGRYRQKNGRDYYYPRLCPTCRELYYRKSGDLHNQWKGGRKIWHGYVRVWVDVPGKYEFEHRLVWENAHGPIPKGWQTHHLNGDKSDNRLENLMCLPNSAHQKLHAALKQLK